MMFYVVTSSLWVKQDKFSHTPTSCSSADQHPCDVTRCVVNDKVVTDFLTLGTRSGRDGEGGAY